MGRWEVFINYAVYMNSVPMPYIPSFKQIGPVIQNLILGVRDSETYRIFFVISFYLQSVPVHSANCVKSV
jgi:hypothetical protein